MAQSNSLKAKTGMSAIKMVRKLLLNTPVNSWQVTGVVREWIYKKSIGSDLLKVKYLGVDLSIPGHDLGLAPGLLGGYYEKLQLNIFKKLATSSEIIVDVGANVGLYTVVGAKSMKKSGKIYAFEPIPQNIKLLKGNIKLNKQGPKVTIAQYALGDQEGELDLHISLKSVGNHSAGVSNAKAYADTLSVKRTTLDTYIKSEKIKKLDLLKIDVEGYDGYVLRGAQKTIKKFQPALMIESIPKLMASCGFSYDEFIQLLVDTYKYCYTVDEVSGKVAKVTMGKADQLAGKLKDTNLVLVNKPEHKKIVESFLKV